MSSARRRKETGPRSGHNRLRVEPLEPRVLLSVTLINIPDWIEQGPRPITGVVNVPPNNLATGAVESVAINPSNSQQIYVGTVNGGVWRTDNADPANPDATTWTPLTDQMASLAIGDIAFSPLDATGQTLYAGTGSFSSLGQSGGPAIGVLRTANGGATWSVAELDPAGPEFQVRSILPTAIDLDPGPGVQQVVLAGTVGGGGLYRSNDNGATWSFLNGSNGLPAGDVCIVIADPNNSQRFYAGVTNQGVFQGNFDSGTGVITWTETDTNITGLGTAGSVELAAHDAGANTVLFALVSGTGRGAWRSIDNGGTWTQLATPPAMFARDVTYRAANFIVADPTDSQVAYITTYGGGDDIFRYDPAGAGSWVVIDQAGALGGTAPHADGRHLAFIGSNILVDTDDGGIYFIQNPLNASANAWHSFIGGGGTGLGDGEFTNIAWDNRFNVIVGGMQDNGTDVQTGTGNKVWRNFNGGDGGVVQIDTVTLAGAGRSIRYDSSQNLGGFERNVFDSATNIVETVGLIPGGGLTGFVGQFVNPVEINACGPLAGQSKRIVIGGGTDGTHPVGVVYEADNAGIAANAAAVNWVQIPTGAGFTSVASMAYGGRLGGVDNPDVLYVGSNGNVYVRSTAGGTLTPTATPFPGGTPTDIALDPNDWRHAFVVDSGGIWETTDAGATWTDRKGNLPIGNLQTAVFVNVGSAGVVLVGGQGGVYRMTTASPGVWTEYGQGMPHAVTYDLEYDSSDDVLVAGTLGRGAWTVASASTTLTGEPVLMVTGTNGPDSIRLVRDPNLPNYLDVFINNASATPDGMFELATLVNIMVDGLGGNDTLTVDSTNGLIPVPIEFNGGTGRDTLVLSGGTATSSTYTPGPTPDAGVVVTVGGGITQAVSFTELEPVIDLVPAATLTVNATNGANAINYSVGTLITNGLVTIDNFESIEFSNKTTLVIDGLAGSDEINLNNPNTPTGLTGITVNGGDPTASDTLILNGAAGISNVDFAPTAPDAATITGAGPVPISASAIEHVNINFQAGGDTLTVTTPAGIDIIDFTPGTPADTGTVAIRRNASTALLGVSFSSLPGFLFGTGLEFDQTGGGRADTLVYHASDLTPGGDGFEVSGSTDTIGLFPAVGGAFLAPKVTTTGINDLVLGGSGHDDFFNIFGALPYSSLRIDGAGGSDRILLQATPTGPIQVNFNQNAVFGLGTPVEYSSIEALDLAALGQALTVLGNGVMAYTPTGADAGQVVVEGQIPKLTFHGVVGAFTMSTSTVQPDDELRVLGTSGNDTVTSTATTITVNGNQAVTVGAGFERLVVSTLQGDDNIAFSVTAAVAQKVVDAGDGNDIVNASGATAGLIVYGGEGDDDLNASAVTTAATLFGGAGDDTLHAAVGGGLIDGGDGDDVLLVNGGLTGALTVEGGDPSASDVLALTGAAATVETVTIAPDAINPTKQSVTGLGATITASGVELIRYTGTGTDDTLTVSMGGADGTARVDRGVGADRVVSNVLPQIEFTGLSTFAVNTFGGTQQVTFETSDLAGALPGNYQMQAGFGDTLIIEGGDTTSAQDIYTVTNPAGAPSVAVTDGSFGSTGVTVTETAGSLGRLQINGLGGDDTVTVNVNGPASDVIGVPITFDGGPGADSLLVTGTPTTAVANVIQTPGTSPGDGRLLYKNAGGTTLMTIDYANLEPVTDLVVATTLTVNGTNAANVINYTQGSVAARGLVVVDNNETLEFSNKAHLVINGLGGSDTVGIDNASTPTSLLDITVNGGGLPDVDTLIVDGTSAADAIVFTATGPAAGTVAVNSEPLVNFATIGPVILKGLGGDDAFGTGAATPLAGPVTFDGGQGDDTFRPASYTGDLRIFGGQGSDTMDFATTPNAVTLDLDLLNAAQKVGSAGLTVALTDAIENFTGSAFNDKIFVDALDVPRTIDGGPPTKVTPGSIPPGDLLTVDGENQFVDVNRIVAGQPSKDSGTVTAFSYAPITFTDIEKLSIVDTQGSTGFGGSTLPPYVPGANYKLVGPNPGNKNWTSAIATANIDSGNADPNFLGNNSLDMVVVHNRGIGLANVFINRGDGTFLDAATFNTGLKAVTNVALVDVDGDGTLDIVATGLFLNKSTVSVLLGNNDGTFGAFTLTQTTMAGNAPALAVGDVDGDGSADLVVSNGKKIRVLLNNGAGVFAEQLILLPADPFNKGWSVRQLVLADLDGGGTPDLVAVAYKANRVTVFQNTGAGTFGAPTSFIVAGNPRSVAVGDVNVDGRVDIVAASANAPGVSVLLGDGSGGFTRQAQASSLKNKYQSVALGDVNSDGKLDLVLTREVEHSTDINSVYIMLGAGNGTFSNPYVAAAHDTEHHQPIGLAVADFNSDGGLDIACVDAGSFDVSLLLKNTVI